jgi:hypothetical protein
VKETFRYNSVLLPEYISAIVISLLTTLIVSTNKELWPAHAGPHSRISAALYGVVVLTLVWLTVHARWRWPVITVESQTVRGSLFGVPKFRLELTQVHSIQERAGKFYGRRARRLTVRSFRHDPVEIADFIYEYERLKQLLGERWGQPIEQQGSSPEVISQLAIRARKRDVVFGRPRPWRILLRIPVRVIGLLPVLVVDMFFTFFVCALFRGDSDVGDPRAVYSAPISLAAAGLAARFIYYRISSSIRLNRVVRFRWGRRGAVKAGA